MYKQTPPTISYTEHIQPSAIIQNLWGRNYVKFILITINLLSLTPLYLSLFSVPIHNDIIV